MPVSRPHSRQRAVTLAVAADDARIVEAAGRRFGPARAWLAIDVDLPHHMRMHAVLPVEGNSLPIDEALACPSAGEPQGVVVVKHPGLAAGNASGPGVEPHGDSLVGNVAAAAADFVRTGEMRAVVHRQPGLQVDRLRAAAAPLGKRRQVAAVDGCVLRRVMRP